MNEDVKLTLEEAALTRQRRIEAMHLHTIEGNPLDAGDVALFERFEREGWSHQRRIEYLQKLGRELAGTTPARCMIWTGLPHAAGTLGGYSNIHACRP